MLTVRVYDNYDLIALQGLETDKQVSHKIICATGKIITNTSLSRIKKYFLEKMKALLNLVLTKIFSGINDVYEIFF